MNTPAHTRFEPHRFSTQPESRPIDIKGMVVALAFLVGISWIAGGRGDITAEADPRQEAPAVHDQTQLPPAKTSPSVEEIAAPAAGQHLERTQ